MPIGGDDGAPEYRLTEEDMECDWDMLVQEYELDEKGRPLIDWVKPVDWLLPNAEVYKEWEEDEEDEDVNFIDLYEPGDKGDNGSEDSHEVYGKEEIDKDDDEAVEGEQEDVEGSEEGDDNVPMTVEWETSGPSLGSRMRPLGRPDSGSSSQHLDGDAAEDHFHASTQEIGERLLGRAMTPKDFFTSPEEQQDSIQNIVTQRKPFLARNACLIIDLEAAAREDTEEQGIHIEEMD